MKLLLCVQSWSGATELCARHWPYFQNAGASKIIGIGTDNGLTRFPDGVEVMKIGDDRYLHGNNVCRRLLHTILYCLDQPDYDHFCIAEYDSIFFHAIPEFTGIGAHYAGGKVWGSQANAFYHNPWMFDRESGMKLQREMAAILSEGHCGYGTPESSPDVFFGWACERSGLTVNQVLQEYSRNSLDTQEYLDEARNSVQEGVHVVHGIKTEYQLNYITGKEDGQCKDGLLLATAYTDNYKRADPYVESLKRHCNIAYRTLKIGYDMADYFMPNSIVQAGHFLRHIPKSRTTIFTDADIVMHRPIDADEIDFLNNLKEGQISACHNKGEWQPWSEEVPMLQQRASISGFDDVKVFNTGFVAARTATWSAWFEQFKLLWPRFDEAFGHYAKVQLCMCAAAWELGFEWVPTPKHLAAHGHFACPEGIDISQIPPKYKGRVICFDHRLTH
jgi:hypothetical protein